MYMNAKTQMTPLSNDQLIRLAPSIAATQPIDRASKRYDFVSTIEVIDLLRSENWLPVKVNQSNARKDDKRGYQKHMIRFIKDGLAFNGERVDLLLTNSHDTGSAFHLDASIWRQICGNGLMVSSNLFSFAHNHINFDRQAFLESAYKVSNGAGQIAEKVESLKTIELTPDERGVFATAAHSLLYDEPEKAPITPDMLLKERRYDDKGNDLWTTYNVIQENAIKGGVRTSYEFQRQQRQNGAKKVTRQTRGIKAIDKDIKLNKALWTLTEKMQELKTT